MIIADVTNECKVIEYNYFQNELSSIWVIDHNLNGWPNITVIDNENRLVEGDVIYENEQRVVLKFSRRYQW